MGFTQTSEGRVFFKNADNDDLPRSNGKPPKDPVMPSDNTQMQILLLLKSLNTKLKSSKEDQAGIKKQLARYKATIKSLEEKAGAQETNYIDLEQKVARKQNETSKKASRVEQSMKKTLTQLEEAKELVKLLEEKAEGYDTSLEELKEEVSTQKQKDEEIAKRQKTLEKAQKEQGEKMVDTVATYVSLTKRVGESETRQEALENKIEDARSDYLKLDRKIDKAIEDRNRILRKVDRIEQAVLETRDALNAKAMVLLTDQGVAGVDMPQLTDESAQADPMALSRRIQEEAMMPWWRRPVRIQSTSLALMMVIVMLLGWIISEARQPAPSASALSGQNIEAPRVSLHTPQEKASASQSTSAPYQTGGTQETRAYNEVPQTQSRANAATQNSGTAPVQQDTVSASNQVESRPPEDMGAGQTTTEQHGIRIHKGYSSPEAIKQQQAKAPQKTAAPASVREEKLDVTNDAELLAAMEQDPERVARALNDIEPASLTRGDLSPPQEDTRSATTTPPSAERNAQAEQEPLSIQVPQKTTPNATQESSDAPTGQYLAGLKKRISPDPNLTDVAKKIERQAFNGVPEAQHDMGAIYVAGHGAIDQNLDRAVLWFTEAANNGVANAKYNLGVLYHQGMGVERSVERAMSLYADAAELGHPEAQYNLGIANIEGIGVPYNPSRAARFFERAADQGVTEAAYNLGLIYENGLLGETRPDEALAWYKRAADDGSAEAQSALEQLAQSLGISVDDVNRIVEKVQTRPQATLASTQGGSQADSYLISQIQTELKRRGLYPGPIDGMSGPMTMNAIKAFQQAADLDMNGTPSQELLNYLRASSRYSR